MDKLTRDDLYSLEDYAEVREGLRARILEHKRNRQLAVGPHVRLYFEDRLTIQYQVQEMLRVERIFERAGIEEELGAYNPLIPDGRNWKATFMLEYEEVPQRRSALARMKGIEDRVWARVHGHEAVYAIADEDLDRASEDKTSSVHFLRFELDDAMAASLGAGAGVAVGVDHEAYRHQVDEIPAGIRDSLAGDLA